MSEQARSQFHPAPERPREEPVAPPIPLTAARRRRAFLRRLAAMSSKQRRSAAGEGRFSRPELTLWAANYPDEVPLVNGELPWIALALGDLDVGDD